MKVCIVGASGKLGRYMVRPALERGYDVVRVCREIGAGSRTPSALAADGNAQEVSK